MKVNKMTPLERGQAALANEPVDRLPVYPLACGVCRRLVGDGGMTYQDWCSDPEKFASAFIAGQNKYNFDYCVGLMDLSVMAGDLGAHVRMDEQNTPFVDGHLGHTPEDYENLSVPDVNKGRTDILIKGTELLTKALKDQVVCASFIEGPLLALSQTVGAEDLFMDMFDCPEAIHTALKTMTEYDREIVKRFGQIDGLGAVCWDYLWGNYACLGDEEYKEFELDYAMDLNNEVKNNGMAVAVHNCADLPHLETQIKTFGTVMYSYAYYPQIEGSPTVEDIFEGGYADRCLMVGQIDPQTFMRNTAEETEEITKDLCQEVKTAMCKRGLKSRYCISSGCEVPPGLECRMENIGAVVDATEKYAQMEY